MVFVVVCGVALVASLLTFFTGFGLGTLLLPALLFFFEPEVAVALTAVVHLAASFSAFAGALTGNLLLKKVTFAGIQKAVAVLLVVVALGLGSGAL